MNSNIIKKHNYQKRAKRIFSLSLMNIQPDVLYINIYNDLHCTGIELRPVHTFHQFLGGGNASSSSWVDFISRCYKIYMNCFYTSKLVTIHAGGPDEGVTRTLFSLKDAPLKSRAKHSLLHWKQK